MLFLLSLLLFLAGAFLILLLPALWGEQIFHEYREARTVNCPETHAPVSVRFNAMKAAWSTLSGSPSLRLSDCTRWPERANCGQECVPDAIRANPESAAIHATTHAPWHTRRVVHLPVFVAAAAAWVLGMAWHSEYVFRPQWMMALGLSDSQTRALARMMSPHLLSVGACVLFAYGVANLLRLLGSRTLTHGVEVSAGIWLAMFGALMTVVWSQVAPGLLWIEGGYTLLAALLIGAIVGGAPRWIVLGDPDERALQSR